MAKLLTQSYQYAVLGAPKSPKPWGVLNNNPAGLTVDPEFLAQPRISGFLRPWESVTGCAGAAEHFGLHGAAVDLGECRPGRTRVPHRAPDPFGMVVNPANQGLTLPTSAFPRNDQTCYDYPVSDRATLRECTLDHHPFTIDMHDAGRSTSRGDLQEQGHTFIEQ
jgi:hypothetical protein